jgi:hypothetical protein
MTMITKQYFAGFVDGEGNISIYRHKDNRTKRGYTLHPFFKVSGTNNKLLGILSKEFGGKVKLSVKPRGNAKSVYVLEYQELNQIINVLSMILPYLILKKEQAELMVEFCKKRIKNKGKIYSKEEMLIADKFLKINRRGRD